MLTSVLHVPAGTHPWGREHAIRASAPALGASGSVNACFIFNILAAPYQTVLIYGVSARMQPSPVSMLCMPCLVKQGAG